MLAISTPTLWGYRNQSRFHTKASSMNDEDIFGGTWKYLRRSVNISESFLLKSVLIPKINFVTLYTGIGYMSIPFQTYFERDLHCFWKNNVKTLRFPKLCLYQWCHIQWEVDYAWRLFCLLVLHRIPVELCNVLTDTTFRVCILSFFEACLQLFSIVSAAKLQLFSNKSKFFLQLFANSFPLNRMFFVKFGGKTFVFWNKRCIFAALI